MKALNPEYKPHLELVDDDATWDVLKAKVQTFLRANADKATVSVADMRALDAKLSDDKVWAQLAGDLGLFAVPEPPE